MPLHLLGKKSWNVYNADNIARVRRDEAAAKAAEEAEEQRMQEVDAQRRLAILRGEAPPPIEDVERAAALESPPGARHGAHSGSLRRKRKRPDEDDTEFELRVARENTQLVTTDPEPVRKATSSAPIVDHAGHIDLFGDEKLRAHAEKNEDAEKEAKKKERSFEDQYTMRFSNAAGNGDISNPWYSQSDARTSTAVMKNVWGKEDPNRRERDTRRIVASDPLAMMKQGASKIRELNKERKQVQEEQAEQLRQLRREERHREKRQRRHEERGDDGEGDRRHRHSDDRRRLKESKRRDDDRDAGGRRRYDKDESRDRRRERSHRRDSRDESRERRREKRSSRDERHSRRDSQSPRRQANRESRRRHRSKDRNDE
ncbi:hypothetical protein B0T10DRAFT_506193 [Thelonectria olida]|uniref:CBF1-interacting co-repressor CIR N-terminal domain-containing protein n=1 Tax=Thelonectria olida TaxID=1576542 RepID=A0A9P8WDU9_9HYPO|nr:hypothetical protein B0T10DRAFT_506193 [Thelonectria olida]